MRRVHVYTYTVSLVSSYGVAVWSRYITILGWTCIGNTRLSSVEVWLDFGFWLLFLGAGPDRPIHCSGVITTHVWQCVALIRHCILYCRCTIWASNYGYLRQRSIHWRIEDLGSGSSRAKGERALIMFTWHVWTKIIIIIIILFTVLPSLDKLSVL